MSTGVLLADDSSVMRNAIVRLLKDEPSCEVVGEASGFAETIKLAAVLKPDVLLLDLHMPDEREYPPHVVRLKIRGHAQHILALSIWNTRGEDTTSQGHLGSTSCCSDVVQLAESRVAGHLGKMFIALWANHGLVVSDSR